MSHRKEGTAPKATLASGRRAGPGAQGPRQGSQLCHSCRPRPYCVSSRSCFDSSEAWRSAQATTTATPGPRLPPQPVWHLPPNTKEVQRASPGLAVSGGGKSSCPLSRKRWPAAHPAAGRNPHTNTVMPRAQAIPGLAQSQAVAHPTQPCTQSFSRCRRHRSPQRYHAAHSQVHCSRRPRTHLQR